MNTLLLFFALPVATIILAIVLQKLLNNPILVGLTFFAIYLVVTFAAFDESFLVFAIVYTILAYITAVITRFVKRIIVCQNSNDMNDDTDEEDNNESVCNCMRNNYYSRYRR